ncbi:MAG: hypothetical protein EHM45_10095 [Desulfobacteraceae bacterium]|nr:MAG: hypothetical protein EHM45_10095 [Desulfobacteraceae bacterium]
MENIEISGRTFYLVTAQDEIRDGISAELWEIKDGLKYYLAEIFRNDNKKTIEFTAHVKDLPLESIKKLIEMYEREVPNLE